MPNMKLVCNSREFAITVFVLSMHAIYEVCITDAIDSHKITESQTGWKLDAPNSIPGAYKSNLTILINVATIHIFQICNDRKLNATFATL